MQKANIGLQFHIPAGKYTHLSHEFMQTYNSVPVLQIFISTFKHFDLLDKVPKLIIHSNIDTSIWNSKENKINIRGVNYLNFQISEALKSKGSVDKAVEHINSMSSSELKSKLEKIAKEIAEKRASKKSSKQERSKSQSRGMPPFMQNMMDVKKEIKSKHSDIKDGPALSKVVSEALKAKGDVKGAIEHLNSMSSSELKSKLDKVNKEIAEKRAAKKAANS